MQEPEPAAAPDITDTNVNNSRFDDERNQQDEAERQFRRFRIKAHLETLQEREAEERCFRTFVLHEAARRYGYAIQWPQDAWKYEKVLWQPAQGHRCVRPPCPAVPVANDPATPDRQRTYMHCGKVYRNLLMHPCSTLPCIACIEERDSSNAGHRLTSELQHDCACHRCVQFSLPRGSTFCDPLTGAKLTSSGTMFVCRTAGVSHYCPLEDRCDRTYINTNERRQGYVCLITSRYKGGVMSRIPEYDEDRKIATSRINKMKEAEERDEADANYDSADEDWDFEVEDDDVNNPDERADIAGDEEMVLEPEEHENERFDSAKLRSDFYSIRKLSQVRHYAHTADLNKIVDQLDQLHSPKRQLSPGSSSSPAKRQRRPRTPRSALTPEERTQQHLRNPEDRALRIREVFRLLTDNSHKITMYRAALHDASREANERVDSAKRKSAARELSNIECRTIWFSAVLPKLPPVPRLRVSPMKPDVFVQKIEAAWVLAAHSPIAKQQKQQSGRKRGTLNLVKIAFGVLYVIADGGYKQNCSLEASMLTQSGCPTQLDGVDLTQFHVRVLPGSRELPEYIVPRDELGTLRQLVRTPVAFSDKTEFEGRKLLKACITSKHAHIRSELINELSAGPTESEECLRRYIAQCQSLQC
jgi:hypothetical protein